ncbi:MAG: hypothetical protein WCI18_13720 [Pseudomonadota bacterium]
MDDAFIKERKIREKELRRKMYLSGKERLKNDPVHQARLLEQKLRMKAYRAAQTQKTKDKIKKKNRSEAVDDSGLNGGEELPLVRSSHNPLDLLIQTASDSTLRPLGEIISVDFRNKIRREMEG